jgi:hypothetical protein
MLKTPEDRLLTPAAQNWAHLPSRDREGAVGSGKESF